MKYILNIHQLKGKDSHPPRKKTKLLFDFFQSVFSKSQILKTVFSQTAVSEIFEPEAYPSILLAFVSLTNQVALLIKLYFQKIFGLNIKV